MFTTAFTKSNQWDPILSHLTIVNVLRTKVPTNFNIIHPQRLDLAYGLVLWGFKIKVLYAFLCLSARVLTLLLESTTLSISAPECKLCDSPVVFFILLVYFRRSNILSDTINFCSPLRVWANTKKKRKFISKKNKRKLSMRFSKT